jgi:hypothetical protein
MASETRKKRSSVRLAPGQVPDPLRAHGAWVYLVVCILAGGLVVPDGDLAAALLAGSGFVGMFVLAGAVAVAGRGAALARSAVGLLLVAGAVVLALRFGARPWFGAVAAAAGLPALVAAWFARRQGFLSPGALSYGVTALVVSAPVAAWAGGATDGLALAIFASLAPVFFWRTWRLARAMGPGWTKAQFQRRGLLESALAVAWAALAVVALRLLG